MSRSRQLRLRINGPPLRGPVDFCPRERYKPLDECPMFLRIACRVARLEQEGQGCEDETGFHGLGEIVATRGRKRRVRDSHPSRVVEQQTLGQDRAQPLLRTSSAASRSPGIRPVLIISASSLTR